MTSRCSYAVGWSSASATIAEQLAPGIFTTTFPVSGVSTSPVVGGSADMWFGAGSDSFPRLAFVGRFAPEKGIRVLHWSLRQTRKSISLSGWPSQVAKGRRHWYVSGAQRGHGWRRTEFCHGQR